jgi:drug/metabolite transporter (DMT)-like permease
LTTLAVGMALSAALLHAAWNVRLKSAADPLRVAALAVPLGTVAVTPIVAVVWLRSGTPLLPWPAAALAGVAGLLELAYFQSLSRAYRRGDISAVYPVARGTAPVLAALVGLFILREKLTTVQAVGVGVLVVGIWLARPPLRSRSALVPALLTGVFIAGYTTVDRLGVRMGPFWLYAYAHFVATSITLVPWMRRGVLSQAVPVGVLSVTAYGLALAALSLAPLALVAPLRESGVVLVAVWGVFRMGERERASLKLAGAAVVLAGAALLVAG